MLSVLRSLDEEVDWVFLYEVINNATCLIQAEHNETGIISPFVPDMDSISRQQTFYDCMVFESIRSDL